MSRQGMWRAVAVGSLWVGALVLASRLDAAGLDSWREGAAKNRIESFLRTVTDPASKSFVPERERIAVFDFDGTLVPEHEIFPQYRYSVLEVVRRAEHDPALRARPVVKTLAGILAPGGDLSKPRGPMTADMERRVLESVSKEDAIEVWSNPLSGKSPMEVQRSVRAWWDSDQNPTLGRPRRELVYQPTRELIDLLRSKGFQVFIVSGSSVDFLRAIVEDALGVPPQNVIGTYPKRTVAEGGTGEVARLSEVDTRVDKEEKVLAIDLRLGRRPIVTVGNSDGDEAMLAYTTSGAGQRMGILIRHDDAAREYSYDRNTFIGRLDKALDRAPREGWLVVSMRQDWKTVFPSKKP